MTTDNRPRDHHGDLDRATHSMIQIVEDRMERAARGEQVHFSGNRIATYADYLRYKKASPEPDYSTMSTQDRQQAVSRLNQEIELCSSQILDLDLQRGPLLDQLEANHVGKFLTIDKRAGLIELVKKINALGR
jgi:hypothetical protein